MFFKCSFKTVTALVLEYKGPVPYGTPNTRGLPTSAHFRDVMLLRLSGRSSAKVRIEGFAY